MERPFADKRPFGPVVRDSGKDTIYVVNKIEIHNRQDISSTTVTEGRVLRAFGGFNSIVSNVKLSVSSSLPVSRSFEGSAGSTLALIQYDTIRGSNGYKLIVTVYTELPLPEDQDHRMDTTVTDLKDKEDIIVNKLESNFSDFEVKAVESGVKVDEPTATLAPNVIDFIES